MELDSRCRSCKHSAMMTGRDHTAPELACLYILDEGEPRGCPAGDDCDKYKAKRRMRRSHICVATKKVGGQ